MKQPIHRPLVMTRGADPSLLRPRPAAAPRPSASAPPETTRREGPTSSRGALKPAPRAAVPEGERPPVLVPRPPRARSWVRQHGAAAATLIVVLAVVGVVQGVGSATAPTPSAAEGTILTRVWEILHLGALASTLSSFDHAPLGWIQIAAYVDATGAFGRYGQAVLAGREAMLFFTLASVALLWAVARRLGLGRVSTAAATLLFGLSPLGLEAHRTVSLDAVAVPWLLLALLLGLSRRHQVAALAGAALAFAVAVLSVETAVILLPFLAFAVLRPSGHRVRRAAAIAGGAVLLIVGGAIVLVAAARGDLLPRAGSPTLVGGIVSQLNARAAAGSVTDPSSPLAGVVGGWLQADVVLIVVALAASAVAVFLRRLRPFGVLVLFSALVVFSPSSSVPVLSVTLLLPFAVVVVAGVAETAVVVARARHERAATPRPVRVVAGAWIALSAVAVAAVVPLWSGPLRELVTRTSGVPLASAETWVDGNVPHDSHLIVADAAWVDLVDDGFAHSDVLAESALPASAPSASSWKDTDFVVTGGSGGTAGSSPVLLAALTNSTVVARFASGGQTAEVRQVHPQGAAAYAAEMRTDRAARAVAGAQLARNANLKAPAAVLTALRGGDVDSRMIVVLGQLLSTGPVTVGDLSPLPGEVGETYRRLVIRSSAALPGSRLTTWLKGLGSTYAPTSIRRVDRGAAIVFTPLEEPGLIG